MNTRRFIHQQVMQLRWHFGACLGLIMVLPLEEAAVNLKDGLGFYSSELGAISLLLAPLLGALLACANVQADLDHNRDIFWRSKPVTAIRFMSGKFLVGLILALLVLVCPCLFVGITMGLAGIKTTFAVGSYLACVSLILLSTYSVGFFCNVLIRKTAQAWLIGVAATFFVLLICLILPLNIKDLTTDVLFFKSILIVLLFVALGFSVLAFVGSILAVRNNWQVHTNLKLLLWGGAGLIFVIALSFTHQIANIKVLDEKTITEDRGNLSDFISNRSGRFIIDGYPTSYEVSIVDGSLKLQARTLNEHEVHQKVHTVAPYEVPKELSRHNDFAWTLTRRERSFAPMSYRVGHADYSFVLKTYYRPEKITTLSGTEREITHYERAYLQCDRWDDWGHEPVSFLNLSDYVQSDEHWWSTVFLIKDKAIVILNKTCLVVDISNPTAMKVIERTALKRDPRLARADLGIFPLLPLESLDKEDRVQLSIALSGYGPLVFTDQEGCINYVLSDEDKIARYDVVEVDGGQIHCQLRDERHATPLEHIGSYWINERILQNGELYLWDNNRIMVFDVAGPHIRKLGYFVRFSSHIYISDMKVLDDGNILLSVDHTQNSVHLQLLKNPK